MRLRDGAVLAFIVAVLVGGSLPVAVRFSNDALPPFWGAGLQTTVAAVIMAVSLAFRIPFPRSTALGPFWRSAC